MKLVTTALEWSYVEALQDVSPKHLEAAAEQLTLRRDVIYVVDTIGKIEGSPVEEKTSERRKRTRNEFEPSGLLFWLKVRTRGPQPSILVRTFGQFTKHASRRKGKLYDPCLLGHTRCASIQPCYTG